MASDEKMPKFQKGLNEKQSSFPHTEYATQRRPFTPRARLSRYVVPLSLLLAAIFVFMNREFLAPSLLRKESTSFVNPTKVDLEAHIMSKCPDARDCLQQLILPTMERVSHLVNFKLSYIGSIDPQSDNVSCMHGPSECLGNIIQLCAQQVYPDPKLYLGFANCMTSDYQNIPDRELVEGCAMEHGLDFNVLNKCISDEGHNTDLLRKSVEWSAQNHVLKSCTVRLNGKVRCVRDGGKWYDCPGGSEVSDLVNEIEELHLDKTYCADSWHSRFSTACNPTRLLVNERTQSIQE